MNLVKEREEIGSKKEKENLQKRPAAVPSSSKNSAKKLRKSFESSHQPTIDNFLLKKQPILSLCGSLVVEGGLTFSCFNSEPMQLFISLGKEGAHDKSEGAVKPPNIRSNVQEEASELRKELKHEMKGNVISLSTDMASSTGRCFLGEKMIFIKASDL